MASNEKKKRISIFSKLAEKISPTNGTGKQATNERPRNTPRESRPNQQRRPAPLPSYAETIPHNPTEGISASEPRECRQLLRELYAMNVFIMNCTHVFEANKPLIKEKEERASAALTDLRLKVETWLAIEGQWTPDEMKTILEIHELIKEMQPMPVQFHLENPEDIPSDMNEGA